MGSWEIGTLAEALTEYESLQLAVFAPRSIPPPAHLRKGEAKDVLSIAKRCACPFPSKPYPTLGSGHASCVVLTLPVRN
jgi:hypothetical protein